MFSKHESQGELIEGPYFSSDFNLFCNEILEEKYGNMMIGCTNPTSHCINRYARLFMYTIHRVAC